MLPCGLTFFSPPPQVAAYLSKPHITSTISLSALSLSLSLSTPTFYFFKILGCLSSRAEHPAHIALSRAINAAPSPRESFISFQQREHVYNIHHVPFTHGSEHGASVGKSRGGER